MRVIFVAFCRLYIICINSKWKLRLLTYNYDKMTRFNIYTPYFELIKAFSDHILAINWFIYCWLDIIKLKTWYSIVVVLWLWSSRHPIVSRLWLAWIRWATTPLTSLKRENSSIVPNWEWYVFPHWRYPWPWRESTFK